MNMGWPYLICFLEITCTSARELLRDLGKKCGMTYEDKVKVIQMVTQQPTSETHKVQSIMLGTVNTVDLAPVLGTQMSK